MGDTSRRDTGGPTDTNYMRRNCRARIIAISIHTFKKVLHAPLQHVDDSQCTAVSDDG